MTREREIPKILEPTMDFVFKQMFTKAGKESLTHLINSIFNFPQGERVSDVQIRNPEIPRESLLGRACFLDIHAWTPRGEFIIEMQCLERKRFLDRVLYYWGRVFASQLTKGQDFVDLHRVYSLNFLNFNLFENNSSYRTDAMITYRDEKSGNCIFLTDKLRFAFVELKKLKKKNVEELSSNEEAWIYFLSHASRKSEESMGSLIKKYPFLKDPYEELKYLSEDRENRELYHHQLKTEHIISTEKSVARLEGREEGREEAVKKIMDQLNLSEEEARKILE